MSKIGLRVALIFTVASSAIAAGCSQQPQQVKKDSPAKPEPRAAARPLSGARADLHGSGSPRGLKPAAQRAATAAALKLTGLTMTVPPGWSREEVTTGALAPKAAFTLPGAEGATQDCTVRITHYPNMKGMKGIDEMNIKRWIGQVTRPDGTAYTRETANVKVTESGHIRLTTIDVSGTIRSGMGASGGGLTDHRMIAAIVDHPHGPHFVKAIGPTACIAKSETAIRAFLASARTD